MDADPKLKESYDWYESYLENGKTGLRGYLGTLNEIDFKEVEEIVESYRSCSDLGPPDQLLICNATEN